MLNYKTAVVVGGLLLGGSLLSGCRPGKDPELKPGEKADTHNQVDPDSDMQNRERRSLGLHTHDTKLEFRPKPMPIVAGEKSFWSLKVIDLTMKKGVADFKLSHEKVMHLIVVSKDLTWFNHIHPVPIGYGALTTDITLPAAGDYKLYADYIPVKAIPGQIKGQDGTQEVAQKSFNVVAPPEGLTPKPLAKAAKLVADKPSGAWIVKQMESHPEGEPDSPNFGPPYEVAFMPMPAKIRAGEEAMLHFQVRNSQGQPLKDLQPYLGAMGHAVILSEDSNIYLHSHPMAGGHNDMKGGEMNHDTSDTPDTAPASGGPDVMFHTTFPAPGLYKIWGQFQHKDLIITAPFVVKVEPGAEGSTSKAHKH